MAQNQILTDIVYTVALENRDTSLNLWIGTPDGVALSSDMHGSSWSIYQTEYDTTEVYAYPNPFSPFSHNQLGNNGYIRFHTGKVFNTIIELNIFNFGMEKVYSETFDLNTYRGAIKWNGRDSNGIHAANGVYFARLNYANSSSHSPSDYWTKFIMVK